jgi:hypothetical protein
MPMDADLAKALGGHVDAAATVRTAATAPARTVLYARIEIITQRGSLNRKGQKPILKNATEIVLKISGDPNQAARSWVLPTGAASGGWGMFATTFGKDGSSGAHGRGSGGGLIASRRP